MTTRNKKSPILYEPAEGYGFVVGRPDRNATAYVAYHFEHCCDAKERAKAACHESYHKVMPVVILTKADYRRLLKAARPAPRSER